MKARILVVKANDGRECVVLHAIADEYTMDVNDEYLPSEVQDAKKTYGDCLVAYGFVDVEIPDDVIALVLRTTANAGAITAAPVEREGES